MICARSGLEYHVIDSEWKENYITPNELENLLRLSEDHCSNLKTVVTISVRHTCCLSRTSSLVGVMKEYRNASLCLVAGNRTYLDEKEAERSAARRLVDAARVARKHLEDRPIFAGMERLGKKALETVKEYRLVPFLLMDKSLEDNIVRVQKVNGKGSLALYLPYLTTSDGHDATTEVMGRLWKYALRRQWVRSDLLKRGYDPTLLENTLNQDQAEGALIDNGVTDLLVNAVRELSIYGTTQDFIRSFEKLKQLGINTVIGLPLREEEEQVMTFSRHLQRAQEHRQPTLSR